MSSMTTLGADHATVVAGHNAVSRYKKLTGTMSLEQTDHSLILSQRQKFEMDKSSAPEHVEKQEVAASCVLTHVCSTSDSQ
jgi:hypothetical protein